MDNVIAFVFYLVLFLNAYLLFVMVTGRRGKPIEVALFAVISMTLSFWLDNYFIVLDPFYVLFFSYFTKKNLPMSYHVFYGFYVYTMLDLSSRIIAFIILPTLLNVSVDTINQTPFLLILSYALVLPYHLLIKQVLHLNYHSILQVNGYQQTDAHLYRALNISMVVFYFDVQGTGFWQHNLNGLSEYTLHFRNGIIFVYVIIFFYNVYHLNQHAIKLLNQKMAREQEQHYQHLANYNTYLESIFEEVRSFKDETNASLEQLGTSIQSGNIKKVESSYNNLFAHSKNPFKHSRYDMDRLINLEVPTIKSFLAAKLFEAQKEGLTVSVEVPELINAIPMKLLDFVILISIFCDNAIEAARQSKDKSINVAFFKDNGNLHFYIENSSLEEKVQINQLYKEGFSTKGQNRGIGLSNAAKILEDYPFCSLATKSHYYTFSQELILAWPSK